MVLQLFEITTIVKGLRLQKACTTACFSLFELYSDSYVKIQGDYIFQTEKKNAQ